jgi:hypothetical protein
MSIEARFWPKVEKTAGCWIWRGSRDRNGYGRISERNKPQLAHRVSWRIHHAAEPTACVLHRCDNPPCVNPAHLFLGSRADNSKDMIAKGRFVDQHAKKSHCPAGHPYSGTNLKLVRRSDRNGGVERHCRACQYARKKERRERLGRKVAG